MIRTSLVRPTSQSVVAALDWIGRQPDWLRPALIGSGLIYAIIWSRGGLIALPVALLYLWSTHDPNVWRWLVAALVLAPLGGFLGGLVYAALDRLLAGGGRVGGFIKVGCAAMTYGAMLGFVILPLVAPEAVSRSASGNVTTNLISVAVFGFIGGAVSQTADPVPTKRQVRWPFLVVLAAALAVLVVVVIWFN